jgi:hypothetical protein
MINSIIQWILNLFGLGRAANDASSVANQLSAGHQGASAAAHQGASSAAQDFGGAIKGVENIQGAENIRVVDGDVVKAEQGASLIRDPDDGELLWTNTWNKEVRPEQWQDEWGPLSQDDFDTFWHHRYEFDLLQSGDPEEAERKLQSFGYRDVGHYFQVETTFLKHNAEPGSGDTLDELIFNHQIVSQAAQAGMMKKLQADSAAALQANPELLAPVEGVDLDTYAMLAATSATGGLAPDAFTALLAKHGLDNAKWLRVNNEWSDRMSKDTTHTITQAYGKAFANAGAGQFGGAAAAAGGVMGTMAEAGGGEPVSFERLCEIQGAQTAWAKTGQDVNAMLKHTFGVTAGDWANMSMWWMTKMRTDLSLMERYGKLSEQYEAQYAGGATAGADEDLAF